MLRFTDEELDFMPLPEEEIEILIEELNSGYRIAICSNTGKIPIRISRMKMKPRITTESLRFADIREED